MHVCKSGLLHLGRTPRSGWCICLEAVTRAGPTLILVAFDAFRVVCLGQFEGNDGRSLCLPAIEGFKPVYRRP